MILFFSIFGASFIPRYSLTPVFEFTNISEIGNWTLLGNALNKKSHLQLTSEAAKEFGAVCQRVPTLFNDWMVYLELSIEDYKPGDGFYFYYSDQVCQLTTEDITGFSIWINTSSESADGSYPIYFGAYDGINITKFEYLNIGNVTFPKTTKKLFLLFQKLSDIVKVSSCETSIAGQYKDLFIFSYPTLINRGYFSFVAKNSNTSGTSFSLHTVQTYSNEPLQEIFDPKIESHNRKIIYSRYYERQLKKKGRRSKMPKSLFYISQLKEIQNVTGTDIMLKDAIDIIIELYERSMNSITSGALERIIRNRLEIPLNTAQDKIEAASENLNATRESLEDLWIELNHKIKGIRSEAVISMESIKKEMMEAVKDISIGKCGLESALGLEPQKNEAIIEILRKIALVELVIYIIFFIYKHRKTNGFKGGKSD